MKQCNHGILYQIINNKIKFIKVQINNNLNKKKRKKKKKGRKKEKKKVVRKLLFEIVNRIDILEPLAKFY